MQTALPKVTEEEVMECAAGVLGLAASAGTGTLGVMLGVVGFAVTCGKTIAEELNNSDDHDQDAPQDEDK